MKALRRSLFACLALLMASSAHACTVCNSENGRALRAGLFDGSFLHTFLLVMAPAPILIAAVAILHVAMPDLSIAEPNSTTEPNIEHGLTTACEAAA